MNTTLIGTSRFLSLRSCILLGLVCFLSLSSQAGTIAHIAIDGQAYDNVSPTAIQKGELHFSHQGGTGSVPLLKLTQEQLRSAGEANVTLRDNIGYRRALAYFVPWITVRGKDYFGVKLASSNGDNVTLMTNTGEVSCKLSELEPTERQALSNFGKKNAPKTPLQLRNQFQKHLKAAEAGRIPAMADVASCYFIGSGVERDDLKALQWYQKGAAAGNAQAELGVGFCYFYGCGVPQDFKQAAEHLEKARRAGAKDGNFILGYLYQNGQGVPKDDEKALNLFQEGALAGSSRSMLSLAGYYLGATGRSGHEEMGVQWLKIAVMDCGQAHVQAVSFLARFYLEGIGADRNPQKALALLRTGSDCGDAASLLGLGYCYQGGKGVTRDAGKAWELFQKAADLKSPEAIDVVGYGYINGMGGKPNPAKGVEYLAKSAEMGFAPAKYHLGWCYLHGVGVETNKAKGVQLYRESADGGFTSAKTAILAMEGKTKDPVKVSGQQLLDLLAAGFGDGPAQQNNETMSDSMRRQAQQNEAATLDAAQRAAEFERQQKMRRGENVN